MPRRQGALKIVAGGKPEARSRSVSTPSGAKATARGDQIEIRDPAGSVIVTYDAVTGAATITAPRGDLRLEAPCGKVVLSAADDLELLSGAKASLRGAELELGAERTRVRSTHLSFVSDAIEMVATVAGLRTGRWELHAERTFERATDVFREVQGLIETRAGRVRSLVEGAMHCKSGSTSIVSKEDTFVDGRRVLLG